MKTETLILKTNLSNLFLPHMIQHLCEIGYLKTGNKLAEKWNIAFCDKMHRERKRYYVHGHFSTISDTKLEAITKYLK